MVERITTTCNCPGTCGVVVCKRASLDSPRKAFKKADFEDGVRVYF